jgi:hypothetical protein
MWYRVNDPLNPLCGADVLTGDPGHLEGGHGTFYEVRAMRRVDVFVGDRPYQLIAPEGQSLGILVASNHLVESPIQDDVVEIATDRPYGPCVEERDHARDDGLRLRVVEYVLMSQVAVDDSDTGELLSSATVSLGAAVIIEEAFLGGNDREDMQFMIANEAV